MNTNVTTKQNPERKYMYDLIEDALRYEGTWTTHPSNLDIAEFVKTHRVFGDQDLLSKLVRKNLNILEPRTRYIIDKVYRDGWAIADIAVSKDCKYEYKRGECRERLESALLALGTNDHFISNIASVYGKECLRLIGSKSRHIAVIFKDDSRIATRLEKAGYHTIDDLAGSRRGLRRIGRLYNVGPITIRKIIMALDEYGINVDTVFTKEEQKRAMLCNPFQTTITTETDTDSVRFTLTVTGQSEQIKDLIQIIESEKDDPDKILERMRKFLTANQYTKN